jgi:ribokinase
VAKVIVVGSANVDLIWHGPRLPRPGETVSDGEYRRVFGGKGANQASAAARLGMSTAFVGCVGDDDLGAAVRADLEARGIDSSRLVTASTPTGVALITVATDGENAIAVAPGANRELTSEYVTKAVTALAVAGDVVLVSLEITLEAATAALIAARRQGARTVLNPAPWREDASAALFEHCDVVVPNEHETAAAGGIDAILAAGASTVVMTRGARGVRVATPGAAFDVDGCEVDVVDTTGAGDAFCGALASQLAEDAEIAAAVEFAAAAAALACTALGARTALPSRDDVAHMRR